MIEVWRAITLPPLELIGMPRLLGLGGVVV
jgi:hypothetical protein